VTPSPVWFPVVSPHHIALEMTVHPQTSRFSSGLDSFCSQTIFFPFFSLWLRKFLPFAGPSPPLPPVPPGRGRSRFRKMRDVSVSSERFFFPPVFFSTDCPSVGSYVLVSMGLSSLLSSPSLTGLARVPIPHFPDPSAVDLHFFPMSDFPFIDSPAVRLDRGSVPWSTGVPLKNLLVIFTIVVLLLR